MNIYFLLFVLFVILPLVILTAISNSNKLQDWSLV
jgi:hypothetical protein